MESTELTVRLIILFIPGIIETFIYGICQNKGDMSDRNFVINVVLSAFVMYSITHLIFRLGGGESTFLDALLNASVEINIAEVLIAALLSVAVGFLQAMFVRKMMELNRKRDERGKKVRMSVWDDLFDKEEEYDGHVKVILKEQGVVYEGYVEKYSASATKKKELYLKNAVKYDLKTGEKLEESIVGAYLQIRDDEDVIMEIIR